MIKQNYVRDVQGEVWKQWFEKRNEKDTIIKMNTGSGKTVVALMILQSCLNEGVGPAMYVVPDKYLVTVVGIDVKEDMSAITPEKANDIGERLIIVPKMINQDLTEVEVTDALVKKSEDCNMIVLVPSFQKAQYWKEKGGIVLSADNISKGIEKIKSGTKGMYVIVNRYDGIDLPDDACRMLIIDGLPNISNIDDKYEQEVVRKSERIQREQIQRIEQGMGRGVRSHNDYCLIYLIGNELTNVLYGDEGYEFFSNATKAQFELSEKLCEQIKGEGVNAIIELGNLILNRDSQWMQVCNNVTSEVEYVQKISITDQARAFRKAFDYGSYGDYPRAEKKINDLGRIDRSICRVSRKRCIIA